MYIVLTFSVEFWQENYFLTTLNNRYISLILFALNYAAIEVMSGFIRITCKKWNGIVSHLSNVAMKNKSAIILVTQMYFSNINR